jgi:cytidylate kinase
MLPLADAAPSQPLISVVAIDGPVGVGKSAVARALARRLGWRHIDTGAMYRAVTLRLMDHGAIEDRRLAAEVARLLEIDLCEDGRVLLAGADVTRQIRDEQVSVRVASVADNLEVRKALVEQQQRLGRERPSVLEGRDIGTVVFPNARHKFYLDAAPEERARRRLNQLRENGDTPDPAQVYADLLARDEKDRNRPWGALRMAADAELVDTSAMTQEQVVDELERRVRAREAFADGHRA